MNTFVDASGSKVSLSSLVGKGGEGSVYRIAASPDKVAKIYNAPLSRDREEKLRAIATIEIPDLRAVCAWPVTQLLAGKALKGFTMPFLPHRQELHVLHGPKSRKAKFPNASYGFLIHVALNVARAFAVLHARNIIVGDVNDRGIMVGQDGTVRIIDCDSFQFTAASKEFLCDVGTPGFTPPELQGLHLRGLRRTKDHDNFGLAILIFLLLFMGRHPFAGRYEKGQIEPEAAIKEYRYAYSRQPDKTLMAPPPNTIAIDRAVNLSLVDLFERAFARPSGSNSQRPTALEWVDALSSLRSVLTPCQFNGAHEYVKSLNFCPWCELEQRSGIDLFNFIDTGGENGTGVDIEPIWQAISGLVIPGVPAPISEKSFGRLGGIPLPPSLTKTIVLLKERKEEGARARQAAETLVADVLCNLTEAENLRNQITDESPSVVKLTKLIARNERPMLRSPLFIGAWFVAMIYIAAVSAVAPEFLAIGFGLLVVLLPSAIVLVYIRRRRLPLLKQRLNQARYDALVADPVKHGQVLEIERLAREVHENAKAAEAVADALEADARKLAADLAAEKRELKSRLHGELAPLEAGLASENSALNQLRLRARDLQREYDLRCLSLRDGLTQWRQLKARRDGEIKKLRDHDRSIKLDSFLDGQFISQADIPGITPALKAALASFGIETAADVNQRSVLNVQGFGRKRTDKMLAWRRRVASRFSYVPNQAVDVQKIQAIHARFANERRRFERDFQVALTDLREKSGKLAAEIQPVMARANEFARKAARVRADIEYLDGL
jgi:DNA-binding helix-hairpin-helix protein with protein kinase domain